MTGGGRQRADETRRWRTASRRGDRTRSAAGCGLAALGKAVEGALRCRATEVGRGLGESSWPAAPTRAISSVGHSRAAAGAAGGMVAQTRGLAWAANRRPTRRESRSGFGTRQRHRLLQRPGGDAVRWPAARAAWPAPCAAATWRCRRGTREFAPPLRARDLRCRGARPPCDIRPAGGPAPARGGCAARCRLPAIRSVPPASPRRAPLRCRRPRRRWGPGPTARPMRQRRVHRQSVDPGGEGGIAPELGQAAEDANERLLRHLLGIHRPHDAHRQGVDPALVAVVEGLAAARVAAAHRLDQGDLGHGGIAGGFLRLRWRQPQPVNRRHAQHERFGGFDWHGGVCVVQLPGRGCSGPSGGLRMPRPSGMSRPGERRGRGRLGRAAA